MELTHSEPAHSLHSVCGVALRHDGRDRRGLALPVGIREGSFTCMLAGGDRGSVGKGLALLVCGRCG